MVFTIIAHYSFNNGPIITPRWSQQHRTEIVPDFSVGVNMSCSFNLLIYFLHPHLHLYGQLRQIKQASLLVDYKSAKYRSRPAYK